MRFALVFFLAAAAAHANPKVLPFSYGTYTSAPGAFEIEQYVDIVPVRVERELPDGNLEKAWSTRFQLQTELEYGLTESLELGFYFVFSQDAGPDGAPLVFEGVKQRVRWRLTEPGAWPVDIGLYLEIAEFFDELEFEEKILLQRQLGPFVAVANLWIEQEHNFTEGDTAFFYNPTAGIAYQPVPWISAGLEYWARGRFDPDEGDVSHHYLGPTVSFAKGEYWIALGAYLRLDHLGATQPVGEPFGRVWVRVIAGIGL